MTTVNPVFSETGEYIGSEIEEHITPPYLHEYADEYNPYSYDEATGDYEPETIDVSRDDLDPDEYYQYNLEYHPVTSEDSTVEEQAYFWLSRDPLPEHEIEFLAQAIADVEDEYERDKAEALLMFRLGHIEYHELPDEVREQLDEILGFDSSDNEAEYYEDEESYDDSDEEESPELVEALTNALPDLAALAEQEGQEELQFYFEANQMLYNGEITDAEYKTALINTFGAEGADEVAELGTSIALEYLGIA